jgi:hypothetical protein
MEKTPAISSEASVLCNRRNTIKDITEFLPCKLALEYRIHNSKLNARVHKLFTRYQTNISIILNVANTLQNRSTHKHNKI